MFCGSRLAASSAAPHHIVPGGLMIEDILRSKPVVRSNVAPWMRFALLQFASSTMQLDASSHHSSLREEKALLLLS